MNRRAAKREAYRQAVECLLAEVESLKDLSEGAAVSKFGGNLKDVERVTQGLIEIAESLARRARVDIRPSVHANQTTIFDYMESWP